MIEQFSNLTKEENDLLLQAPAYVSVFAASEDNEVSNYEKADALKMAHLRTFTAPPLLQPYYREAEEHFEVGFGRIAKKYAPFNDEKRQELKQEVDKIYSIIAKLDPGFAKALHKSLFDYAQHVKRADKVVLEDFIFPFLVKGFTV